jgi:hypothetical protein
LRVVKEKGQELGISSKMRRVKGNIKFTLIFYEYHLTTSSEGSNTSKNLSGNSWQTIIQITGDATYIKDVMFIKLRAINSAGSIVSLLVTVLISLQQNAHNQNGELQLPDVNVTLSIDSALPTAKPSSGRLFEPEIKFL